MRKNKLASTVSSFREKIANLVLNMRNLRLSAVGSLRSFVKYTTYIGFAVLLSMVIFSLKQRDIYLHDLYIKRRRLVVPRME